MIDHDQRFKVLIQEFFREFLALFFPTWVRRFDLRRLEWLQQEMFPYPPQGPLHRLDLVAKVGLRQPLRTPRGTFRQALVHVEVESKEQAARFQPRMYHYYKSLCDRHGLPVLPLALFLRLRLKGLGVATFVETFGPLQVVRFRYHYAALKGLKAERYLRGSNWLGVTLSVLMRMPARRRIEYGLEAMQRLAHCPESEYRRRLLGECVMAYLPLDEAQRQEFQRQLLDQPDPEVRIMTKSLLDDWHDKGLAEGLEKGLVAGLEKGVPKGQRRLLQLMLEKRFGPLSPAVRQRLEEWPVEKLEELGQNLLDARSLRDLGLEG